MDEPVAYKHRILIVDDDPTSLKILESFLPREIYQVARARNGEEALELVFDSPPDLVLLDIMMPGLDGLEVTKMIKRDPRTSNIPIILVTSLEEGGKKVQGLEAGAEELLHKPVRPAELMARVKSMLRLKEYRDQLSIRNQTERAFHFMPGPGKEPLSSKISEPCILLVEDSDVDARVIENALEPEPFRLVKLTRGKDVLRRVHRNNIDLVLLDILLPDMDGFDICRRLKAEHRDVQVVIVTCLDDLDSKIKGVELGADDFLVKPVVARELRARIKVLLEKKRHLDSLRTHYEWALDSASMDWLTGLYNHGFFQQFLDHELPRSRQQGWPVGLIMMDVDDFKRYNDALGHSAGDAILREMGRVVRNVIRELDVAARYGGEEFAVVLPYANREAAVSVAGRIHRAIGSHDFFHDDSIGLQGPTVSMGIAVFPHEAAGKDELIERADRMLYRAKQEGKNRVWSSAGET